MKEEYRSTTDGRGGEVSAACCVCCLLAAAAEGVLAFTRSRVFDWQWGSVAAAAADKGEAGRR